jgi:hypothetical protein
VGTRATRSLFDHRQRGPPPNVLASMPISPMIGKKHPHDENRHNGHQYDGVPIEEFSCHWQTLI